MYNIIEGKLLYKGDKKGMGNKDMKKSAVIEKDKSYIMVVPKDEEDIKDLGVILDRLQSATEFKVIDIDMGEEYPIAVIKYKDKEYKIEFYPEDFEMHEMYRINHKFQEEEYEAMINAEVGLTVGMIFSENHMDSYHLQLKVIDCLVPNKLGLLDFNIERILSGKWATIAAKSKVPPSPGYLYTIQAISGEGDDVWLHTHGLNRCGVIEFEILNSSKEYYQSHGDVLDTLAKRVVSEGYMVEEEEPYYLVGLNNGLPIVGTWIDYSRALKQYNPNIIGGFKDRVEGHNENTGVFYIYTSQEEEDNKDYKHISVVEEHLAENPLHMITTDETNRMKALAEERIFYFKNELSKEDVHGIMKFGLLVDDEYQEEYGDSREHIWFEVKEIKGSKIIAILTQEPYYISGIAKDDVMELNIKDMTDWILYTEEGQITPDLVYLLD